MGKAARDNVLLFFIDFFSIPRYIFPTMPITTSAKKALRQSVRRRARNIVRKDAYKDAVKAVRKFVVDGKDAEARQALSRAYQALDKAAKTHAIKKNKASRLKSRLTKVISKTAAK